MTIAEAAYIAGLFDGEGSITYKKYKEKKKTGTYNCWRIVMEISMTDQSVLIWLTEVLGCGTLRKKPRKGHKMQWRWRCSFRDEDLPPEGLNAVERAIWQARRKK